MQRGIARRAAGGGGHSSPPPMRVFCNAICTAFPYLNSEAVMANVGRTFKAHQWLVRLRVQYGVLMCSARDLFRIAMQQAEADDETLWSLVEYLEWYVVQRYDEGLAERRVFEVRRGDRRYVLDENTLAIAVSIGMQYGHHLYAGCTFDSYLSFMDRVCGAYMREVRPMIEFEEDPGYMDLETSEHLEDAPQHAAAAA